jgi:predicted nucleotidyltransferase
MMLSRSDKTKIIDCAKLYGVTAVWLFGSSLGPSRRANDIDLAVEGLRPDDFFPFYRELYFSLSKPVDLVDLGQAPPLEPIIRAHGRRIYAA